MKEVKNMSIISKNNASKLHEDSVKPLLRKKTYVNKIVASVTTILIALTPNLGALTTEELLNMSENQLSTTLHTKDRDTLLPLLPTVWSKFWNSYDAVKYDRDAAKKKAAMTAYDATYDDAWHAAWYAANDAANGAAKKAAWYAAWDEAFANAWYQGGDSYNIVMRDPKIYDDAYFRNLVEVLVQQIKRLQQIVQQNQE